MKKSGIKINNVVQVWPFSINQSILPLKILLTLRDIAALLATDILSSQPVLATEHLPAIAAAMNSH